jgi:hypothetical protein
MERERTVLALFVIWRGMDTVRKHCTYTARLGLYRSWILHVYIYCLLRLLCRVGSRKASTVESISRPADNDCRSDKSYMIG